jgi:hypothetical protein
MADLLSFPQLTDYFGGFDQAIGTLLPLGPGSDGGFFIENFSRTEAEKNASWVQQAESGKPLGHNRWNVAKGWAGHRGNPSSRESYVVRARPW